MDKDGQGNALNKEKFPYPRYPFIVSLIYTVLYELGNPRLILDEVSIWFDLACQIM